MMRPCSSTRMARLFRTVDSRCAITNTVRPSISESMPCSIRFSVRVSMELVASSRISTGGSDTAARAMASSCRSPWLRLPPSPVMTVSYPWGRCRIKLSALASFAAARTSSSVASSRP